MSNNEILSYVFDDEMCQSIMNFAQAISNTVADVFVVMSRKAACFIRFLERHGNVFFDGELVTDRILDIDLERFAGKDVVIIDDVVVSGTTIYTIVNKLKSANAKRIRVFVLGVNKEFYSSDLFKYVDAEGVLRNYIEAPYIPVSDAACMRICSNIVSTFALDISPYDVDFPRHNYATMSQKKFNQIISCSDWLSYDVSSDLQSQNDVNNITLLPTERIDKLFDEAVGIPVSKLGFYKIRLFAKYNAKKEQYTVNAVPYFLFNEITEKDIDTIYSSWFENKPIGPLSGIAKVRILQYVLAEKLFTIWTSTVNNLFEKKLSWELDKSAFCLIFPKEYYNHVVDVVQASNPLKHHICTLDMSRKLQYCDNGFESKISIAKEQQDNIAVLQTKLIEPFTNLYFTKEKESRRLVLRYGEKAFDIPEYKQIIERLNHGYSYHMLVDLLEEFPEIYDKVTTVSLFVDEAIDAGIIVPIIAEEYDEEYGTFFFRAYRHGEDVPFGELQEKLCSILLANYAKEGGSSILSNLRIEKMLVLFIRIGMKQGVFKPSPQDSIYYNVNVDSYLYGNIATIQDVTSKRPYHYLKHRTDARWLSEVLKDKGILETDEKDKVIGINDYIDISIDKSTKGKVAAIGQTFAKLYKNGEKKEDPFVTDDDLVLFSTCMTPQDILNALAAELAIFADRWQLLNERIRWLVENNPSKIVEVFGQGDIYTSVNSGQDKFFNFIERKAQNRINKISEQLSDSEDLSIYGALWDQFWAENRNWDNESIDRDIYNTIISEGKYLMIFNILSRLLLLCASESEDKKAIQKWENQVKEYQLKIKHNIFSRFEELTELSSFANDVIACKSKRQDITNMSVHICKLISNNVAHIPSVLSDVELLVDRHGKPCKVTRYVHALFVNVPVPMFSVAGSMFESYFGSHNIDFQVFPVAEPSCVFPESGLWYFVKGVQISDLYNIISNCITRNSIARLSIKNLKIFFNLSENLRLKMSSNCNTKRHFGRFSSYAEEFRKFESNVETEFPVYWIIEESSSNKKIIDEIGISPSSVFTVVGTEHVRFETTSSSSTAVICTRFMTQLEKFRREYNAMKKKCEIFVSYSEDSPEHVARVGVVVKRLESEGFVVHFYEEAPLGTDMTDFMRKIGSSDITLIIGTPGYKDRAYNKVASGVSFEDRIISGVFMSVQREKLVPISFGSFDDSFPAPYNKLKGMSMTEPTESELDTLVAGLIKRYKENMKNQTSKK